MTSVVARSAPLVDSSCRADLTGAVKRVTSVLAAAVSAAGTTRSVGGLTCTGSPRSESSRQRACYIAIYAQVRYTSSGPSRHWRNKRAHCIAETDAQKRRKVKTQSRRDAEKQVTKDGRTAVLAWSSSRRACSSSSSPPFSSPISTYLSSRSLTQRRKSASSLPSPLHLPTGCRLRTFASAAICRKSSAAAQNRGYCFCPNPIVAHGLPPSASRASAVFRYASHARAVGGGRARAPRARHLHHCLRVAQRPCFEVAHVHHGDGERVGEQRREPVRVLARGAGDGGEEDDEVGAQQARGAAHDAEEARNVRVEREEARGLGGSLPRRLPHVLQPLWLLLIGALAQLSSWCLSMWQ